MNISVRKALTQSDSANNIRVTFNIWEEDSLELRAIIAHHLPQWAELFGKKNSEYGSGSAFELGQRGQFSDIYRKIIKLKRALWDEDESVLTTESVDEILMDLIGHCFLTLEMRRRDRGEDLGMPELDDENGEPIAPMSKEEFYRMVQDAGLFVIEAEPTEPQLAPGEIILAQEKQPDKHDATPEELQQAATSFEWNVTGRKSYRTSDGRIFEVGQEVKLKQHLGKGPSYTILDTRDNKDGYCLLLSRFDVGGEVDEKHALWAHCAWVFAVDEKSPEEQALEASLIQRGRPIHDDPQA